MAGVATRDHNAPKGSIITPDQKIEQQKKRHEIAIDIANRIHKLLSPDLGASVYEDAFINFSIAVPKLESGPSTDVPHLAPVKTTHAPNLEPDTKPEPHKFTVEMVPATFIEEEYEVYKKYQINVHHDKPEKLTEKGYTNFLVSSPLIPQKIEGQEEQKYGSFHMQYRIDGKLIAVGVVDVLPVCLSSVYFFYDPDYHSLSLGVYSAIKEIDWIKNIHSSVPDLKYYYMGYYIHTCPKMKYKGDYHPSELLCLSSYQWVPLSVCVPLLENSKDYISFVSDSSKHVDISKQQMDNLIEKVKIMLQGNVVYLNELNHKGIQIMDPLLRTYVEKVGPELALRMYFVIQQ